MNARDEAKLNMYRTTEQICEDNNAIIATNPAFVNAYNAFKANVAALISTTMLESQVITGIAIDKAEAKKSLCKTATDIAAIIYAFATQNNNNTLKQAVNFAYSDFFRLKDDLLAPAVQNIYNAANDNAAALIAYGITPAILTAFQSAIDAYSTSVPKPRSAKATKGTHTSNISTLIKTIDGQLKDQLDKLIVNFKTSNPDFVSDYHNARIILDPAHKATELKGTITDSITSQPIANATVQVTTTSAITTTDAGGNYSFKPIIHGMHSITIIKNGYQSKTIDNIKAKLGKAITANAALQPNA